MTPGIQIGERFVPRSELLGTVARAATGLRELGIGAMDSVALLLRNDVSYLEATTAARTVGGMPVPINWHLQTEEVNYILKDCGAKALVIHADLLERLRSAVPEDLPVFSVRTAPEVQEAYGLPDAVCRVKGGDANWHEWLRPFEPWTQEPDIQTTSMIYTSGTTGRPKGVRRDPMTPEQYQKVVSIIARVLGVAPGIRTIIPAPMYHAAPNAFAVYATQMETFMVLMPKFDPEEFLRLVETHGITHVQMVPTMFVRLLKLPEEIRRKYDTRSLEYVVHAAAPCPPDVKQAMIDWWGPIIHEYYGSTEMGSVTFCNSEEALANPGTVGRVIDEATVRVYGEQGNEVRAGKVGIVYGNLDDYTDFTYQNDPEKRESVGRDGLVTGGDIGYFNYDGFLFLCDRANDMVISGGVNIYPAEIESVLIQHQAVQDCAVFGIPDEELGETLMAVIEPREGAEQNPDAIRAWLRDRLAHYKVPRFVEFRADLPREDSGKLFKRKLRAPYWDKAGRNI